MLPRTFLGNFIARIGVAHDTRRRIIPQHPLDARFRSIGTVAANDQTGVLREAHADATTVMEGYPGSATRSGQQQVEQRPVGNRVGTVQHRLGLTIGTRYRTGIKMITANDHGCFKLTGFHHFVERNTKPVAIAEANPADTRRQSLETDAALRHVEPVVQMRDRPESTP